jgi:hypothetical protein
MAISNVQNWTHANATANTVSLSLANNPASNNLSIAFGMVFSTNTLSIADNSGDGVAWSVGAGPITWAAAVNIYGWYKIWGGSISGKQATLTEGAGGANAKEIFFAEYTGSNTTQASVLKSSVSAIGTTGNPDPGNQTASTGGLVVGFQSNNAGTPTAGTGFTRQSSSTAVFADTVEDQFIAAGGTFDANWSGITAFWGAIGLAFDPPAGFTAVNRRSTGPRVGSRSYY